jgi:hypothetical protein
LCVSDDRRIARWVEPQRDADQGSWNPYEEEARRINRSIHLKYVMPEPLSDVRVSSYLSEGDDVTVKVHMDRLISWNLSDTNPGKALSVGGWFYPFNDELASA